MNNEKNIGIFTVEKGSGAVWNKIFCKKLLRCKFTYTITVMVEEYVQYIPHVLYIHVVPMHIYM